MKNFILKTLKIFISGLIIGILLMIGVYLIPTGRIVDNVEKSKEILKEEGHYNYIVSVDKTTMIDNYTDSIMLNEAMYHGDGDDYRAAMDRLDELEDKLEKGEDGKYHYKEIQNVQNARLK